MIFLMLGYYPNADKLSTEGTGCMSIMTWPYILQENISGQDDMLT